MDDTITLMLTKEELDITKGILEQAQYRLVVAVMAKIAEAERQQKTVSLFPEPSPRNALDRRPT